KETNTPASTKPNTTPVSSAKRS
ncbi:unnamed protein product, partial [Diplocarpon coronariae]